MIQTWMNTVNFRKGHQELPKLKHKEKREEKRENGVHKSCNATSSI